MSKTAKELFFITFFISCKIAEARKVSFLFICVVDCSLLEYFLTAATFGIFLICICAGILKSCKCWSSRASHNDSKSIELENNHPDLQNDQQTGVCLQHEKQEAIEDIPVARPCFEHTLVSSSKLVSSNNPSNDSSNRPESPMASPRTSAVWVNRFGQVAELDSSDEMIMYHLCKP